MCCCLCLEVSYVWHLILVNFGCLIFFYWISTNFAGFYHAWYHVVCRLVRVRPFGFVSIQSLRRLANLPALQRLYAYTLRIPTHLGILASFQGWWHSDTRILSDFKCSRQVLHGWLVVRRHIGVWLHSEMNFVWEAVIHWTHMFTCQYQMKQAGAWSNILQCTHCAATYPHHETGSRNYMQCT